MPMPHKFSDKMRETTGKKEKGSVAVITSSVIHALLEKDGRTLLHSPSSEDSPPKNQVRQNSAGWKSDLSIHQIENGDAWATSEQQRNATEITRYKQEEPKANKNIRVSTRTTESKQSQRGIYNRDVPPLDNNSATGFPLRSRDGAFSKTSIAHQHPQN